MLASREEREARVLAGNESPRYRFDHDVLGDEAVKLDADSISLGGIDVPLRMPNPFDDTTHRDSDDG